MNLFNLTPLSTTDLITIVSVIMTAIFSWLLLKATRTSNKIAKAIEDSNNKEKTNINNQNRYLVKYNLGQMQYALGKHSGESSIGSEGRSAIKKAMDEIEKSNLTHFFSEEEIKRIIEFQNFMSGEFNKKVLRTSRFYKGSPFSPQGREMMREESKQYAKRELPVVKEAIQRVTSLLDFLN